MLPEYQPQKKLSPVTRHGWVIPPQNLSLSIGKILATIFLELQGTCTQELLHYDNPGSQPCSRSLHTSGIIDPNELHENVEHTILLPPLACLRPTGSHNLLDQKT